MHLCVISVRILAGNGALSHWVVWGECHKDGGGGSEAVCWAALDQARLEGKESELLQKPVPVVDRRANWRGRLTRRGETGLWLRDTASLQLSHREEARVEKPWPHCCPLSRAYLVLPLGPTQTEDSECVGAEPAVCLLGSEPGRAEGTWEEPSMCGEKSACAKVRQTVKFGSFHRSPQYPSKAAVVTLTRFLTLPERFCDCTNAFTQMVQVCTIDLQSRCTSFYMYGWFHSSWTFFSYIFSWFFIRLPLATNTNN